MKRTGEWGEFFPPALSPFGYNETIAQEYFPLSKKDALIHGYHWYDTKEKNKNYMGPTYEILDDIQDVSDDIVNNILFCEATKQPYKIIQQELKFYREMGIPIPRKCPDQRHKERLSLRTPRELWNRECSKCSKDIQTTYAPERPEIVYCEECYLKAIFQP